MHLKVIALIQSVPSYSSITSSVLHAQVLFGVHYSARIKFHKIYKSTNLIVRLTQLE